MKDFCIPLLCCLLALVSCQSETSRVHEVVEHAVAANAFNGYLYVEKQGKTLYSDTLQSPGLSLQSPADTTKVYLASLTKLFTKVAILRLHDQGTLELDAPISQYRPQFTPSFGQRVSIRHLLNMSSGLPRELIADTMPLVQFDRRRLAGPFLDTIQDFDLAFEPGTKTEYSNLNYWLLGSLIEAITDQDLHSALTQLIFQALNMRNSGLFNSRSPILNGYSFANDEWEMDATAYEGRYASGGCYSSIHDLQLLAAALSGANFLQPESKKLLTTSTNRLELYGSLPGNSNMFIQDFEQDYLILSLNNIGLRDLAAMTTLKTNLETELGIQPPKRGKRVVNLNPIEQLADSVAIEQSLKVWAKAVETEDAAGIYAAISTASVAGSMAEHDRTWEDLSQLNKTLPNFHALGYRWVTDQPPAGLEIWFGSGQEGKLAIRWLPSETDSSLVENLFIMPDDMTWQGRDY